MQYRKGENPLINKTKGDPGLFAGSLMPLLALVSGLVSFWDINIKIAR